MEYINHYTEKKPYDIVYGIQKTSFNDYGSNMCTVLFTGGCNLRCPYCHNMSLVNIYDSLPIDTDKSLIPWLKERYNKGNLTHLVITGGEPTIHKDGIVELIQKIKHEVSDKIKIKLDTNGTNPGLLDELLVTHKCIDYVAMDIKCIERDFFKFCKYITSYTSENESPEALYERIEESIYDLYSMYLHGFISGIEFRTTIFKDRHNYGTKLSKIACEIGNLVNTHCNEIYNNTSIQDLEIFKTSIPYYIQNYKIPEWKLNQGIEEEFDFLQPLSESELKEYLNVCRNSFPTNVKPIIR